MTTNKQKVDKVPNLRFPGFEGEWERKKMGEIAQFSKGKGISKAEIDENGKTECIRYGELYTTYNEIIDTVISKTNTELSKLILSEENDIIIPASGETQIDIATASCVMKSGIALGGDLNIIKTPLNGIFLSYYLNSKKKMEIANLAQGISVVHLYSSQLSTLEINYPSSQEQSKIAGFLSLCETRIQQSSKIIEGLQSFKNAVIKKIFSQELRFSVINSEWRKIKLIEVCEKQSSNISANKIEDNFGEYVIYGASGKLKNIDFYDVEDDYISIVKDGAGVGRLFYCKGKSSVLGTLDIIKPKNGIHTYFLYCLLSSIDFSKYVTGSTIPHIYFKDYSNEIIGIPMIEEQTKIADFIFGINEKISLETSLLQQLKLQKQYFLKQMFL